MATTHVFVFVSVVCAVYFLCERLPFVFLSWPVVGRSVWPEEMANCLAVFLHAHPDNPIAIPLAGSDLRQLATTHMFE
jgi:hypothetical protein